MKFNEEDTGKISIALIKEIALNSGAIVWGKSHWLKPRFNPPFIYLLQGSREAFGV